MAMKKERLLTWVEIKKNALGNNIRQLRKLIGEDAILCPCVKANAYGHGLIETSKIFLENGANWLAVNAIYEARALRKAGVDAPIYVLGYVAIDDLEEVVDLDLRFVVYNRETIERLGKIGKKAKVHLKVETGNNRQGLGGEELINFAKFVKSFENIEIEGLSTHFANIEDTTDHSYAEKQLENFLEVDQKLRNEGINVKIRHCANSAATILFPKTHFEMVRVGLSCYGMWPSEEVKNENLKLEPAFCWKSKIAQIKEIAAGEFVGYGCTFKTERKTKLAIVPIGYYDGYDRGVSGKAHVIVSGRKAPVRGRVCMNIIMVDVTEIPEAKLEDEVVLIGGEVTAEMFAEWAGTINYEVTTRVNEKIPRFVV